MAERRVDCPECGQSFNVPGSMKGGIANCPKCKKAVPVGGGPESLFWLLLAAGIGVAIVLTIGAGFAWGLTGAAVVAALAGGIIILLLALS